MQGSRFLRLTSQQVMVSRRKALQQKGSSVTHGRRPTSSPTEFDFNAIIQRQTQEESTGVRMHNNLLEWCLSELPRSGRHNDQAHPRQSILSTTAALEALDCSRKRRCMSLCAEGFWHAARKMPKARPLTLTCVWGSEAFHTHGLLVLERNYLDVYIYDKWESTQQLPEYTHRRDHLSLQKPIWWMAGRQHPGI